jgi:hypothetical protein
VRYGLGLLAASLIVGVATMAGPGKSPITALVALLVFGAVLFNGARRQNWARIVLIVFVAIGVAFNAMLLPIQLDQDRVVAASTVVQCALQSLGVILLLRQSSVRWYGGSDQAVP